MKYVWSYWEGERPPYIDACLASMERMYSTFILVTPETIQHYLPYNTLHANYTKLDQPALKADCIRAALLATHGGFWFDADTVAIKELPEFEDSPAIYTVWNRLPYRILNGYIYIRKGNSVATEWLRQINEALDGDINNISWCSLGEQLLTKLLPQQQDAMQVPRDTFLPIDIDSDVPTFFTSADYKSFITPNTICYGLNHSWFMYHKRKEMLLPKAQWKDSSLLIHQLLNSALCLL